MPDVRKSNSHKEASSCAAPIVDCTLSPNDASEAANFQNYGNFAKQKGKVYLVDLGINDGDKAGKFYHQSSDYEDSEDKNSNVKSELKKDKAATCFFQSLKMPLRKISISRPVFEQRQTSHGHSNHSKSSR